MLGASQAQAHRGNASARFWAYHAVLHGNSADTPPRLLPRLARLRCIHLHDIGSILTSLHNSAVPEFLRFNFVLFLLKWKRFLGLA